MIVPRDVRQESERRSHRLAPSRARERRGATVAAESPATAFEALEARRAHLTFAGARPSPTEFERTIGTNDLVDEFFLLRGLVAAKPVCRIVLRNGERPRGYATGFMVAPRLLLTNCHVFPDPQEAEGALAEFDYTLDVRGGEVTPVRFAVRADLFHLAERRLDFALVALAPTANDGRTTLASYGYHRLVPTLHKIEEGEWITIIQHPGGRRRQLALRANELVDKSDPDFIWYKSDTAQGSSGAPAFNDSFQVVALHHSGRAERDGALYVLKDGSRVSSIQNIDDSRIVWESNEGLRISRLCAYLEQALPSGAYADELRRAMEGGDVMSQTIGGREAVPAGPAPWNGTGPTAGLVPGASTLQLNVAHVSIGAINIGSPAPAANGLQPPVLDVRPAQPAEALEKMVEPIIDRRYSSRKGYDDKFLGTKVPLPEVTDKKLVAKMDDGDHVIPYEHFSVVMHKARRLALFTVSNVDASQRAKQPTPGDYSRRGLSGLAQNDREKWVTDPRIPAQFQLPDKFYTEDRQAFDKGHLVRREDVCWGRTRKQIQRANGDTYHTTNCSPQVKDFNQSGAGGIWGKLENLVLKQAKAERYCVLAGPVLDDDDETFQGRDDEGPVSVQIPQRYWKVVVAKNGAALQAFAFLLEQDLSDVAWEFQVSAELRPRMVRIADLEAQLTGLELPAVVRDADQFGTEIGDEVALEIAPATTPAAAAL